MPKLRRSSGPQRRRGPPGGGDVPDAGFRPLFEHNPQAMWVYELETLRFVEVNQAAVAAYGYPREQMLSMSVLDIRPESERALLVEDIGRPRPDLQRSGVWRHQKSGGELIEVEVTSRVIDFRGARCALVIAQDITERLRAEQAAAHQALHDPLTGLPNRTLLLDRLHQALVRAARGDGQVAVIVVDLDRFKLVNDGLGHAAGDRLLVEAAARLGGTVRAGDTVARLGGDEFAVVMDVSERSHAEIASRRIGWALELPFVIDGSELYLSASQGIAVADGEDDPERLLGRADAAMYWAKERGRARAEFADDEVVQRASSRLALESGLRRAVERDELVLHYQPIVCTDNGRIVGAEALLRWNSPEWGLVGPDKFIPLAEESGLIVPIGEWVLHRALRDAVGWDAKQPGAGPLSVAVNVSARQLAARNFAFTVSRALSRSGIDPSRVHLEITESAIMADPERSLEVVSELKGMGVRVDVDDFGTGYSSLAYVQSLPVHTLKIDKSFVDGLEDSKPDTSIVSAVVTLGRSLGIDVLAEGVETERQQSLLVDLGCGLAQGFHFARPMPEPGFLDLLQRGRLPYEDLGPEAAGR